MTTLKQSPEWCNLAKQGRFDYDKACLANQDWITLFKNHKFNFKTALEAIDTSAPSLATHRKYMGEDKSIFLIAKTVVWVLRMLNINRKPDDGQVLMIAVMIFREFYFLKISEIKFCFYQGLLGKYSDLYGKVDVMDLMKWLNAYVESRSSIVEIRRVSENNEHKKELKNKSIDPKAIKMLSDLVKKIKVKESSNLERQEKELKINELNFFNQKYENQIIKWEENLSKGLEGLLMMGLKKNEKQSAQDFVKHEKQKISMLIDKNTKAIQRNNLLLNKLRVELSVL